MYYFKHVGEFWSPSTCNLRQNPSKRGRKARGEIGLRSVGLGLAMALVQGAHSSVQRKQQLVLTRSWQTKADLLLQAGLAAGECQGPTGAQFGKEAA